MERKKLVVVIGPEGTGSKLIADICATVLELPHGVMHRSLPRFFRPSWIDPAAVVAQHQEEFDIYFVLTTRDITLSEMSRMERFGRTKEQCQEHSERAKEIMSKVIRDGHKHFVWSYETFMFLGKLYLDALYQFLGVESDYIPPLVDGNKCRIAGCANAD